VVTAEIQKPGDCQRPGFLAWLLSIAMSFLLSDEASESAQSASLAAHRRLCGQSHFNRSCLMPGLAVVAGIFDL
jgi:hypothetical protein